jgi:hypothetical protein
MGFWVWMHVTLAFSMDVLQLSPTPDDLQAVKMYELGTNVSVSHQCFSSLSNKRLISGRQSVFRQGIGLFAQTREQSICVCNGSLLLYIRYLPHCQQSSKAAMLTLCGWMCPSQMPNFSRLWQYSLNLFLIDNFSTRSTHQVSKTKQPRALDVDFRHLKNGV